MTGSADNGMVARPAHAGPRDVHAPILLYEGPADGPGVPGRGGEGKKAVWHRVAGAVNHVSTHFPLELVVYRTQASKTVRRTEGMRWIAQQEIDGEAFPNVMRKVIAHAITRDAKADNAVASARDGTSAV